MEDMKEALIYVFALLTGGVGCVIRWLLGDRKRLLEAIEKKEVEVKDKEDELEALRKEKDDEIKGLNESLKDTEKELTQAVTDIEHLTGRRKRRHGGEDGD